jgi:hypothetical protein
MDGRAFLDVARQLVGGTEAHRHSAVGRAYYALLIEARDALIRWGFPPPPHFQLHAFVRHRFTVPSDPDLKIIGGKLDSLNTLRNQADYQTASAGMFAASQRATAAVRDAQTAIDLLDAINADPARVAAAVAAIRAAFASP